MNGKKVLVIDDDKNLRDALRVALETAGLAVLEADNGAEGLAMAKKYKPDLTLLDIMMPKMNGQETLRELRKDEWGKTAQVLLLTSLDDVDNITHGVESKSNDYIIKSNMSLADITKKVRQHLAGYHD